MHGHKIEALRKKLSNNPEYVTQCTKEELETLQTTGILVVLIRNNPSFISYLKPILFKFSEGVPYMLRNYPHLINEFKQGQLLKLEVSRVIWLLRWHPWLAKYFPKKIYESFSFWDIFEVLQHQPVLIKPLQDKLNAEADIPVGKDLFEEELEITIARQPQLAFCFKYIKTEYFDAAYYITFPKEYEVLPKEQQCLVDKKIVKLMRLEKNDKARSSY